MNLNLTILVKALNFMNKKTLIPELDDYILFEKGKVILQDCNKTFVLHCECLNDIEPFLLKKSDFLTLKERNAKIFLQDIIQDGRLSFLVEYKPNKDSNILQKTIVLSKIHRNLNLTKVINESFSCSNRIDIDGTKLKSLLKGYSGDIGFKFDSDKLFMSIDIDGTESFIPEDSFSDYFGDELSMTVCSTDSSCSTVDGGTFVKALGLLGLVKKNPIVETMFNTNTFIVKNGDISVYIYSNK